MNELRRYGQRAGNPNGTPEDITRCIEGVWPTDMRGMIERQCSRKRGHGYLGLYCKQHAKQFQDACGHSVWAIHDQEGTSFCEACVEEREKRND